MAFETGAISFSAIRDHINSYSTVIPSGPISLSNSNIRSLLSGPTATSGAPYTAGTAVSLSQSRSQSWRITITRTNTSASTTTYSIYNEAQAAPGTGETGKWVKTSRPIAFTLTNSSTMRSPSGGSSSYALQTNTSSQTFPAGTTLSIINNSGCYIVGKGGDGGASGSGTSNGVSGGAGGRAIEARYNLSITNNGTVAGGGGGGGGGGGHRVVYGDLGTNYPGGGGGGGRAGGAGGVSVGSNDGTAATFSSSGTGGSGSGSAGDGGSGGNYGVAGSGGTGGPSTSGGAGGAAGAAIGKLSTVTVTSTGNAIATPVTIT